jgi:hypothetical protein
MGQPAGMCRAALNSSTRHSPKKIVFENDMTVFNPSLNVIIMTSLMYLIHL